MVASPCPWLRIIVKDLFMNRIFGTSKFQTHGKHYCKFTLNWEKNHQDMELSWHQHTSNSNSLVCSHRGTSVNSSSNRTTCTRVLGFKLGTQCCFDALSETSQTLFPNKQMINNGQFHKWKSCARVECYAIHFFPHTPDTRPSERNRN